MNEESFVREVRQMERALYRVARGFLRAGDDCADAVQEALCKAWKQRERVGEDYFRPWLVRILINECQNIGRRKKRLVPVAEVEGKPEPPPETSALLEALSALPEKLRLPLTLHYLEGFSLEELSGILRLPVGTIKSRMYQGRKRLRGELEEAERSDCDEKLERSL